MINATNITSDQIRELFLSGGCTADTAHTAIHGWPMERAVARALCAEIAAARAAIKTPLTAETIDDEHIGLLAERFADEWHEADGRRMRLSWWIFDAMHSHHEHKRQRARHICAGFFNVRAPDMAKPR